MAVTFPDLNTAEGIKQLDTYLLHRSYITGYQASRDDLAVYSALSASPSFSSAPHAARWYKHITYLLGQHFPGEGAGVTIGSGATSSSAPPAAIEEAKAVVPPTPAPAAEPTPAAAAADDDDDLDLFGEETEDEKTAKAERDAKAKSSGKKAVVGKSSVLMDVKPWDDETDMAELEKAVRSVQMDGLTWGASKLQPIGYGIKKMTIMLTIVDDLVSLDELIEDKLTAEGTGPYEFIQSCDIVAFNKI